MSYRDERVDQIQQQINHLDNLKRGLRERENNLDARNEYLKRPQSFPASSVQGLQKSLFGSLPAYMMPGNVGGLNQVCWPFFFQIDLDMGDDPVIIDTNVEKNFFQVDQEACLLLMSISRAHNTNAAGFSATVNAPLQVELIDRQSSRRFSNAPTPLQMFGTNSCPSIFPTPMFIYPNGFLDVVVNGIPTVGQNFTGSGKFQLSFFGYRIRTEDTGKVLSTIFQAP